MLNPLAEVGIRVLVPVGICRSQFVVHVLRDRKGCNGEQQQDEPERQAASQAI